MAGQLTAVGAQALANTIGGLVPPSIGTSAPTWKPGLVWIDTTSGAVAKYWNTSAWVAGPQHLYIALLSGDPTQSGPDGGYAVSIGDLIEDITPGYARQQVTFGQPDGVADEYPAPVANTGALTFGPYTTAMTLEDQWAALVTASSGVLGQVLYLWALPGPQMVGISQSIQIGIGDVSLKQS